MKVAIIGGGIGGLCAAHCMRAEGVEATVYEQARELREVGAGLRITPNATRILERLGLAQALASCAVRTEKLVYRRWQDGRILASQELGERIQSRYGAPYYHLHRADLHQAIAAGVAAQIRLGKKCSGLKSNADGVEIRFQDGSSAMADVVVGADGIHSTVREHMLGPDAPRFSGDVSYRGLVLSERRPEWAAALAQNIWVGANRHFVQTYAGKRYVNFIALVPGEESKESWSAQGDIGELKRYFEGWDPRIHDLIDGADAVMRWSLYDRDPLERWTSGRVTLLGDAAHPMLPYLGQGAVQAIEDAALLARCLARARGGAPEAALQAYEAIRRPRTSKIQTGARREGRIYHLPDGEEQRQRDAAFEQRTGANEQRDEWLFGYDVLADYDRGGIS
jgi:salicylate hydroxylase